MGIVVVVVVLLVAGVFGLFALVRWLSRSLHGHPEAPGRCARGGDQAGPRRGHAGRGHSASSGSVGQREAGSQDPHGAL